MPWHSGTRGVFGLLVLVLLTNSCATVIFYRGTLGTPCWYC